MKTLFTAESVANEIKQQEEEKANKGNKKRAGKLTTPLGSRVLTKGSLTETARLDFILITGLVLSEGHRVTVQQLSALGESVGFDIKPARIAKHVKDNKIASVDGSIISLETPERINFYIRVFQGSFFRLLLRTFATELAELAGIVDGDFILLSEDEQAVAIEKAHKEALKMNKPVVIKRKKASTK